LEVNSPTLNANYLTDHLGSTSQPLDSTTALSKARLDYKSYGKLEGDVSNSAPANLFTYTGREDDGTGLMYYRARYYDPKLEVLIAQDPLGNRGVALHFTRNGPDSCPSILHKLDVRDRTQAALMAKQFHSS
jgi:RHS repeat-associated protein